MYLAISINIHPARNITAIIGTIFSVTEASLFVPPRNINEHITTRTIPMIHAGTPKAVSNVEPIELACTIHPINPSARVIATAKNPAMNLPSLPLNAFVM